MSVTYLLHVCYIRGAQAITKGKLLLLQMQWKKVETARLVTDFGGGTKGAKIPRGGRRDSP